jgi:hypothetical protein
MNKETERRKRGGGERERKRRERKEEEKEEGEKRMKRTQERGRRIKIQTSIDKEVSPDSASSGYRFCFFAFYLKT